MLKRFAFISSRLLVLAPACAAFLGGQASAQVPALAHAQATRPDFSGVWSGGPYGNQFPVPRDAFELTPEGKAMFERNLAAIDATDPSIDTALGCKPLGHPRGTTGLPFVVAQKPEFVVVALEATSTPPRTIYFDTKHRADYWPTYNGDSIAQWEGDVLVIETVNIVANTFLDPTGLPHSDELRTVERWRKTGPDSFENEITIYDSKTFVSPFTMVKKFVRSTDLPVENICENDRLHPAG